MVNKDLHTYLDKHGPMSPATTLQVAVGVAEGAEFLHRNNIFHKDLKSLNILVSSSAIARCSSLQLIVSVR